MVRWFVILALVAFTPAVHAAPVTSPIPVCAGAVSLSAYSTCTNVTQATVAPPSTSLAVICKIYPASGAPFAACAAPKWYRWDYGASYDTYFTTLFGWQRKNDITIGGAAPPPPPPIQPDPKVLTFTATPISGVAPYLVTLTWTSANADRCAIPVTGQNLAFLPANGSITQSVNFIGNTPDPKQGTKGFALHCNSGALWASASLAVGVTKPLPPPPTCAYRDAIKRSTKIYSSTGGLIPDSFFVGYWCGTVPFWRAGRLANIRGELANVDAADVSQIDLWWLATPVIDATSDELAQADAFIVAGP